jgi:hypothetical protein
LGVAADLGSEASSLSTDYDPRQAHDGDVSDRPRSALGYDVTPGAGVADLDNFSGYHRVGIETVVHRSEATGAPWTADSLKP